MGCCSSTSPHCISVCVGAIVITPMLAFSLANIIIGSSVINDKNQTCANIPLLQGLSVTSWMLSYGSIALSFYVYALIITSLIAFQPFNNYTMEIIVMIPAWLFVFYGMFFCHGQSSDSYNQLMHQMDVNLSLR